VRNFHVLDEFSFSYFIAITLLVDLCKDDDRFARAYLSQHARIRNRVATLDSRFVSRICITPFMKTVYISVVSCNVYINYIHL